VPEASSPNRQDECDFIIKKLASFLKIKLIEILRTVQKRFSIAKILSYNCLLCDEILKANKSQKPTQSGVKSISSGLYADYEFYKLQVPLTQEKIASSYFKLMNLCSFSK
jgi:hypothetical protein